MHKHFQNLLFAFIVSCMFSVCAPSEKENNVVGGNDIEGMAENITQIYFETVFLPDKDKIFRDVSLDLPIGEVKDIESNYNLSLTENKDDYLQYETDLLVDTAKGVDYVEVKYIFDDADRLDIVTVNYYIQDSSVTNSLFDYINTSFSGQYGDYYIDSDGYTVWESSYRRADTVEVTYDIGIRKFIKINDPGITIELMRFGSF